MHYSDDPFEVLDLQDELQTRYTGGTVVHLFVGEEITNPASVAELVKVICSRYRLPYFTITPTFSICPNHGYLAGKQENCPKCGAVSEVYSRVVGYLRPVNQWNEGKVEEFKQRKTFKIAQDNNASAMPGPLQVPETAGSHAVHLICPVIHPAPPKTIIPFLTSGHAVDLTTSAR